MIETHTGGNESIAFNLVISNTGNRPATNVRLYSTTPDHEKCKATWVQNFRGAQTTYSKIMHSFSEMGEIPLLIIGRSITNSFGYTRNDDQTFWLYNKSFTVNITYFDLEGRRYNSSQILRIKDSSYFAGGV